MQSTGISLKRNIIIEILNFQSFSKNLRNIKLQNFSSNLQEC